MPKRSDRLGQIGDYWLSKRSGSPHYYRTWFNADTRQTDRTSLGTSDLGEAQLALAQWVVANADRRNLDARDVTLGEVFHRYYLRRGAKVASAVSVRANLRHFLDAAGPIAVADLTRGTQEAIRAKLEAKGYAAGTIKRVFTDARTACN